MTELYEVTYQPFVKLTITQPGTQRKTLTLTPEKLAGFVLMANQVTGPLQIMIEGINLVQFVERDQHKLAFGSWVEGTHDWEEYLRDRFSVDLSKVKGRFTAILLNRYSQNNDLLIQTDDPDFFQGSITLCKLFGLNWPSFIIEPHQGKEPYMIKSNFYLGKVLIPNSGTVPLSSLHPHLAPETMRSLSRSLDECFGIFPKSVISPATIMFSSTDPNYHSITSSAAITSSISHLPAEYQINGSYFIFNVCTSINYRGKGLSRSVLIALINEVVKPDRVTVIQLEVEPVNVTAYQLYTSLGFVKVGASMAGGKYFHIFRLIL